MRPDSYSRFRDTFMRFIVPIPRALHVMWEHLTEPSDAIESRGDRYLARLLAALALSLLFLVAVEAGRAFFIPPDLQQLTLILDVVAVGPALLTYRLARTPRFRLGALVMVVSASFLIVLYPILASPIDQLSTLNYLVIPMALSGLFLSRRAMVLIGALNLAGILAAGILTADIPLQRTLTGPFFFVATTTAVIGIILHYQSRYEAERRQEALTAAVQDERKAQRIALHDQARAALARQLDLSTLMQTIVEAVAGTYGYTLVGLYMVEGDELVLRHQVGFQRIFERLPLTKGVMARVARTGQPSLVEDVRSDPDYIEAVPGICSEVCVPLFDDGRCVGVLNVESRSLLTTDDLRLMVALSEHIGVAIERARLYTSLRASEAKLRAIVDNTLDGIFIKDPDGRFVWMNPAGARMVAHTPEEIAGQTDDFLAGGEAGAGIRAEDQWVMKTGQPHFKDVTRPVEGEERTVHVMKFPYRLDTGEIIGVIGMNRDVTERKRVEAELQRVNTHLSVMLNALPIILYTSETEGDYRVTYITQNVTEETGFSQEAFTSQPTFWSDRIHPDDRARVLAEITAPSERGDEQHEYRWQVADGSYRWFQDTGRQTVMPDGKRQFVGVCQDTTERKQAEEALRESQRFIERVADASPQITYVFDLVEQRNVYVSREIASVLGYSPEDIQAMGAELFARILHPDELPKLGERMARFAAAGDDDILESEIRFIDAQRQTHWLHFRETVFARNPDATPRQVLGTATDITGRKHAEDALRASEERFAKAFHRNPAAITITRMSDGRYVDVNDSFLHLNGFTREEVIGHTSTELNVWVTPEEREAAVERLRKEGRLLQAELRTQNRKGEIRHELASWEIIELNGEAHILSMFVDITERKEVEQRQRELAAERERIHTLRRLIGDISHDLKTPLASMRLRYDLLKRAADPDARQRNLDIFGSQLAFLERQVQNLITLWRLDSAEQTAVRFAPVDMNRLAWEVMAEQEPLAAAHGHALTLDASPDLPPVQGDADQLRRMMMHLLVNALNYTPDGGRITLRTRLDEAVLVEVQDSGIGIAPDDLPRIFDPFYRADRARGIDSGGMGLAIARRVAQTHGGSIDVASAPGEGSTFSIRLPLESHAGA